MGELCCGETGYLLGKIMINSKEVEQCGNIIDKKEREYGFS